MPIISHMGVDYDSPNIQIQDNASATDLDNTKVPTGQTIESFLNTNVYRPIQHKTISNVDCGSSGVVALGVGKNAGIVLGCYCSQADICYPACHPTYGWYAIVETWTGVRKQNTSCTVEVYYVVL